MVNGELLHIASCSIQGHIPDPERKTSSKSELNSVLFVAKCNANIHL